MQSLHWYSCPSLLISSPEWVCATGARHVNMKHLLLTLSRENTFILERWHLISWVDNSWRNVIVHPICYLELFLHWGDKQIYNNNFGLCKSQIPSTCKTWWNMTQMSKTIERFVWKDGEKFEFVQQLKHTLLIFSHLNLGASKHYAPCPQYVYINIKWLYVNIGTHTHANLLYWKESDRKLVSLYSIL